MSNNVIQIPINSEFSQKDFENIGLIINNISENDKGIKFYNATLPLNWNLIKIYSNGGYAIIDENNNQRVTFFYNPEKSYLGASSEIKIRYTIHKIDISKVDPRDYYHNEVYLYDNVEQVKVFSLSEDNIDKMYQDVLDWTNKNYPDWENYNAYWDNTNKLQQ
ncbi:MAG: hypothetical protein J6B98_03940 [Bacilli bacterium]|nr:hypothetical protein [Bacilli bacterium]